MYLSDSRTIQVNAPSQAEVADAIEEHLAAVMPGDVNRYWGNSVRAAAVLARDAKGNASATGSVSASITPSPQGALGFKVTLQMSVSGNIVQRGDTEEAKRFFDAVDAGIRHALAVRFERGPRSQHRVAMPTNLRFGGATGDREVA